MSRRRTLKDDVYDTIVERIVSGALVPGERVNDAALADELAVSRTPVREALQQLVGEGFVVTDPNRWTRVAQPDAATVASWYEVMGVLEALAVEIALPHLSADDLDRLAESNRQLADAIDRDDAEAARDADDTFHRRLIAPAARPHLDGLIEDHRRKLRWVDITFFADGPLRHEAVREHDRIMHAVREADVDTAAALVRSNWWRGIQRLDEQPEGNTP